MILNYIKTIFNLFGIKESELSRRIVARVSCQGTIVEGELSQSELSIGQVAPLRRGGVFKATPRNSLPGVLGGGGEDSYQKQGEVHKDLVGNSEENLHS